MDNTFSFHEHHITNIDPERLTAECSICGPVTIYVSCRRYSLYKSSKPIEPPAKRVDENTRVITEFTRKHSCKRCGVYGLGQEEDFTFFELHISPGQRIKNIKEVMDAESLKSELERRDLFCKKCYPHIVRYYKENIPIPPVKTLTTGF